jgi:hypothetical protein
MQIQLSRRQFGRHAILTAIGLRIATLSGISAFLVSCGGNVFSNILSWIPIGEAALNSILAVLSANGIILIPGVQVYVSLIEAGLAALTGAVKEYQATTPPPIGALAKIETAFRDVTDNFKNFLASLNVSGGLVAIIVGLAQVVLSTIAAFMNQLPATSTMRRTVVIGHTFMVGSVTGTVIPKERTTRTFKKDWNTKLDEGPAGGVVIPRSAYLHVGFWQRF